MTHPPTTPRPDEGNAADDDHADLVVLARLIGSDGTWMGPHNVAKAQRVLAAGFSRTPAPRSTKGEDLVETMTEAKTALMMCGRIFTQMEPFRRFHRDAIDAAIHNLDLALSQQQPAGGEET